MMCTEVLVREVGPIYRLASLATTMGDVAALHAKARNNPMEGATFVSQLVFIVGGTDGDKVFHCVRAVIFV